MSKIYEHRKTRKRYRYLDEGRLKVDLYEVPWRDCIIYESIEDGKIYVRPTDEFEEAFSRVQE